jgi:hypothetical protein
VLKLDTRLSSCREAAYLNHFLHLTGVPLRSTPAR